VTAHSSRLNEHFELLRPLGEGGIGLVYEVHDRRRDTRVALKTLKTSEPGSILRLKREFRALQNLSHPNLVRYYDLFEDAQRWYIVMELVRGVPLLDYVRGDGTGDGGYDQERLRGTFAQLASALAYLHRNGKVHRDIKPSNVLVQPSGRVVLLDFGLVADDGRADWSGTDIVGTTDYLAPEQARSMPTTAAADWYSVGVMMYEAMVGRVPFAGTAFEILIRKQEEDVRLPHLASPPPADLAKLCEGLGRASSAERWGAAQTLQTLSSPGAPVLAAASSHQPRRFVGREEELARLHRLFELSMDGTREIARAALVRGESGLGKSSLVHRFLSDIEGRALVLSGTCYERETVPFKAVDAVVDALAVYLKGQPKPAVKAMLPDRAALLADAFPVLKGVDAVADLPSAHIPEALEQRHAMFAALGELLRNVSNQAPLIVSIDDFQWVDDDSLRLLRQILQPDVAPPLLLVLTWRSAENRTEPPELPVAVETIELDRLPDEEAMDLAMAGLERARPEQRRELAEAIARESRGHPLFIDELCRQVVLRDNPRVEHLSLGEALWARIQELDEPSRLIVELTSVAARPLSYALLAVAADTTQAELQRRVAELRVMRLLRTARTLSREGLDIYHSQIRGAVLAHVSAERQRDCHRAIARALEQSASPDNEALSAHWVGAGAPDKAARFAELAGDAAVSALAFDRAARLYQRARKLDPDSRGTDRALMVKLADSLANAGRGADAAAAYVAAAEGADSGTSLDLQWRAAQQYLVTGHHDQGIEILDQVLQARGISFPRTRKRALASLLWQRSRLWARGLRHRPRDRSQISREDLARIDLYWYTGFALGPSDPIRGNDFHARGVYAALRAGEPYRVARAFTNEAVYRSLDGPKAGHLIEDLIARAGEIRLEPVEKLHINALSDAARGVFTSCCGRYGESFTWCDAAARQFRESCPGSTIEASVMTVFAASALSMQGDFVELGKRLPRWLHDSMVRGHRVTSVSLRTAPSAMLALANDDPERAIREARSALEEWYPLGFSVEHWYELWSSTNARLYMGRGAEALDAAVAAMPDLRQSMLLRPYPLRVLYWNLRGRAALGAAASASGTTRDDLLKEVARLARALAAKQNAEFAHAMGRSLQCGLAFARGQIEEGTRHAEAAQKLFFGLGVVIPALALQHRVAAVTGDTGALLAADRRLLELGIERPAAMVNVYAPACDPE